ncbi:hypothetical protein HP459_22950 [Enterobacter sp. CM29]|uniref:hypothetical protein n=1 Tax=Enterobacter sp. CM29 TaxID=2738449 RepID=UPI0015C53241|nr:hypothetical protein [Enterobacter sp. CM29]NQD64233.1 hypothetical protein [Enterobacter sp. CM29]
MGGKDSNYQVVYRGEKLERFIPGGWVFFQRSKESGGGYWFGRTYDYVFMLEFDQPTSLHEGIKYIVIAENVEAKSHIFDDDFILDG